MPIWIKSAPAKINSITSDADAIPPMPIIGIPTALYILFIFAIAIGLGLGADQTVITLLSFVIISTIIILSRFFTKNVHDNKNLYLTIQSNETQKINVDDNIIIKLNFFIKQQPFYLFPFRSQV